MRIIAEKVYHIQDRKDEKGTFSCNPLSGMVQYE